MMSERLEQLAIGWCKLMHNEISRPINGRYQCLTCKRYYPVPWEAEYHAERRHQSVPAPEASDTVNPAHAA